MATFCIFSQPAAFVIVVMTLSNCVLSQPIVISSPPQNVTALTHSTITLDCSTQMDYTGFFSWKQYRTLEGILVYSQPPYRLNEAIFPSSRFRQIGQYGLEISSVELLDGSVYGCYYLSSDTHAFSAVFITDSPVSTILPTSVVNEGDEITLKCNVQFGGPMNNSLYVSQSQFPQLLMKFGDDVIDSPVTYSPGQPAVKPHTLSTEIRRRVNREDGGKLLTCSVSTERPTFVSNSDRTLYVRSAAYDITISPKSEQFRVGDVISCSAKGFPHPTIHWVSMTQQQTPTTEEANITITSEMLGVNAWNCTAYNQLNANEPIYADIKFTVVSDDNGANTEEDNTSSGSVIVIAVVVSVAIAILLIVIIIIIIVVCCRKKRGQRKSGDGTEAEDSKHQLINNPMTSLNPEADYRPRQSTDKATKPVPKPRVASTSTLDGSADLGLGNIKASMTSLNRSFDQDNKQRPSKAPNHSLDKPQPADRPRRTDVRSRGSQESLDKVFSPQPVPVERPRTRSRSGSIDSLDDEVKVQSRRARPVPAVRTASQESLDRIDPQPKPRTRASLDRSLDTSTNSTNADLLRKPGPQVAAKPTKKPKPPRKELNDTDV